jgi:hypothetical protein
MKYEEIYPPTLLEWIDFKYKHGILNHEAEILKLINFDLAYYSVQEFINYYDWKDKDTHKNL